MMIDSLEMHIILAAIADACDTVMSHYADQKRGRGLEVSIKTNNTPLTRADVDAHNLLVQALSEVSDLPVLSEEGSAVSFEQRRAWPAYWLIDPLDGTKEFISGTDEFTVNVAFVVGGRSVLGLIAVPCSGDIYFGLSVLSTHEATQLMHVLKQTVSIGRLSSKASVGDWSNCGGLNYNRWRARHWTPINTRSIAVSNIDGANVDAVVALTSREHHDKQADNLLRGLKNLRSRPVGSSLKMCLIAEGVADVYVRYGPTSEWDTAAAQAILEGAGGKVVDLNGKPLQYNQKRSLLNPAFWASSSSFILQPDGRTLGLKEGKFNADND